MSTEDETHRLLKAKALQLAHDEELPRGFTVTYDVGDNLSASVRLGIGYAMLGDEDYQTVDLDDHRLPFTVEGEFADGLTLVHLRIRRRPSGPGIQQTALSRGGIVTVLREWAAVARKIKREDILGLLQAMSLEIPGVLSFDEVIEATDKRIAQLLPKDPDSSKRTRKRGAEAEATLQRVVERYRELVEIGAPDIRQTIADEEHYHEAHIGRLLVRARKEGLLGPARPGVAGEIEEES